jgi:hypothetical protein
MESEIRQLPVGHALVVGDCVEQPITVEIRVRETKHGVVKFKRPAEEDDEEEPPKRKAAPKPPSFWERLLNVFLRPKE